MHVLFPGLDASVAISANRAETEQLWRLLESTSATVGKAAKHNGQ